MSTQDGAVTAPAREGFKPVNVADVESELAARLRTAASPDHPPSRACALDLIIFLENPTDAAAVSALVDRVATAHPIRVIGTMFDASVSLTDVRAWIKVACGDVVPSGRLCSEEIGLVAHPNGSARLASAVAGLLSPDLPVALWWRGGSPFLSRLFKALVRFADKIVVDSIRFGDGPAALDTLRRLADLRGGSVSLADMNWERTASWRATLSACFDDPGVLQLLPDLDQCEIDFSLGPTGATAPPSARSLLLAGWILSRLPSIAGSGDIHGRESAWVTPGAITGLILRSSKSKAAVSVAWENAAAGIAATATDRNGAALRRWRFTPDPEREDDLLHRCIDSIARDRLLGAALHAD